MQIVISKGVDPMSSVHLSGGELLMLHQITSEAANGIHLKGFLSQVGVSRERVRNILRTLDNAVDAASPDRGVLPSGDFELGFSVTDGRALRNATELVMQDLGHEEFSTRTGFTLSEAADVLSKLNSALLAPLHIERQATLQTGKH